MVRKLTKTEGWLALAGLAGILLLVILISLLLGSVIISPRDLLKSEILWQIRLPRVILAALVGLLLSISGVVLQGILRNPLADPYILGISSGGAVGAAISISLGANFVVFGISSVPATAFFFSLLAVFIVYKLSQVAGRAAPETLILSGVALAAFASAILSLLIIINGNLQAIYFWLLGSLSSATWGNVITVIPYALLGGGTAYFFSKELNALLLGEEMAITLGVEVENTRLILIAAASLMTAAAVSVSGLIGFVGLIVPHWIRLMVGPNHRMLIPFSAFSGMILMVAADLISRTILSPMEIPIGIIMALVGAPFFLYLLRRRRVEGK
ncbi:iron ABC transporter [Candidatus Saganbacteria bacterium CG08_land_8_20_14_0_20_45_16]|uniref:Iron ABC transporter n=1 Tax=Candidatus Saganbacteria bacterium CG08_land_8_20_14_0_20_45_16 TaxID=2014293 RepID=A0A2H0XUS6_UNCSA|nr:MAG: iron ABC transporter [Candidatus Saganbacteria bacterium CG08_land_8_20_14_0_20_45_16]